MRVDRIEVNQRSGKSRRQGVRQVECRYHAGAGQFGDKTGAVVLRLQVDFFGRLLFQFSGQNKGAAQPRQGGGFGFRLTGFDCVHNMEMYYVSAHAGKIAFDGTLIALIDALCAT